MAIKEKYRLLSDLELESLETEFVEFLIVHGIDGSTWEQINKTQPFKAQELVTLFSNIVFDKIVENDSHFIYFNEKMIHLVKVNDELIDGIWIKTESDKLDLRQLRKDISLLHPHKNDLQIFQGSKKGQKKEKEIMAFLDAGYYIDKGGNMYSQAMNYIKKS